MAVEERVSRLEGEHVGMSARLERYALRYERALRICVFGLLLAILGIGVTVLGIGVTILLQLV